MNTSRRFDQLVGFVLVIVLLWAYWPALAEVGQRWWTDPKYSHGYFVPLFAAWLLWRRYRRSEKSAELLSQPGTWWGLPIFVGGTLCHLMGVFFYVDWLSEVALLPSLAGLCVCLGGWPLARLAAPSIAFLAFMLPLPYRAEVALANPLQQLATASSLFLLQMLGITASAEGNIIVMDQGMIGVVDACNGLGMLVTFFALATAVAIVVKRPLLDKLIVVASAIPVALLSNVIRITVTGILCETIGGQRAMFFYHVVAGLLMSPLAVALILLIEFQIMSRLLIEMPVETPESIGFGLGIKPTAAVPRAKVGGIKSRVGS